VNTFKAAQPGIAADRFAREIAEFLRCSGAARSRRLMGRPFGVDIRGVWRVYLISALLSCVCGAGTALVTVRLLVASPAQSLWHGTSTNFERNYD
jgi:hypothetical protein